MSTYPTTFSEAAFDMLCTQIQETGRGSLAAFAPDSDFIAAHILREAARVLGFGTEQYDIFTEDDGKEILVVRDRKS